MIKSVHFYNDDDHRKLNFTKVHEHKIVLDSFVSQSSTFTIKIEFDSPIVLFRNHDYTWAKNDRVRNANWFSPKLVKLKNDCIVQSNQNQGIWQINPKAKTVLLWHFNPENAKPIADYDFKNSKHIMQAKSEIIFSKPLALLFSNNNGIELSRSKFPFSAITCFTDHCDFDTLKNLEEQRQFFKSHDIKVTKGFFLNHYSKREDTACLEHHREELSNWIEDGHELAYHSLSQSIKIDEESFKDFMSFNPPFKNIVTWIDHGFQPYNFTLHKTKAAIKENYAQHLKSREIEQLWSYIDSGTAVDGVINQINPQQFTLSAFYKGTKHLGVKTTLQLMIKNIIFHYCNDDYGLGLYRSVAKYIKRIGRKKSRIKHWYFVRDVIKLAAFFFPIVMLWPFKKHRIYPLAEFTPVFFEHELDGQKFTVFQTLEMLNFKRALHKRNLDLLIKEKGMFIAHTYFSAPMNYHKGKLFNQDNKIDTEVEERFKYMSEKIKSKDIWNPTLSELIKFMKKLKEVEFDCNEKGVITVMNCEGIATKTVK